MSFFLPSANTDVTGDSEKSRSRSAGDRPSYPPKKKTMKTERTNAPDARLRQQLDAKIKKYNEAWDNNDAVAVAAFFTEDAVLVTNEGPSYGRQAIEKLLTEVFQKNAFQRPSRQSR